MMRVFIPTDKAWEDLQTLHNVEIPFIDLIQKNQGKTLYLFHYQMDVLLEVAARVSTPFVLRENIEQVCCGDIVCGRQYVTSFPADELVVYVYSSVIFEVPFDVFQQTFGYATKVYPV